MDIGRRSPSLVKSFLILITFVFACLLALFVAVDQTCGASIEQWIPFYPNAEVISMEHNMFRPRAMGETRTVLFSPDDEETVRVFYRETTINLMRENQIRGLARTAWRTEPNPDGDGTFITLLSECGTQ